jgi:hypothetical protein
MKKTTKKNQSSSKGQDIELLDDDGEIICTINFTDQEYREIESAAKIQGISALQYIVNSLEEYMLNNGLDS